MKEIKLEETSNILKQVAAAKLKISKEYLCRINGEKVRIIK